jgi:hypothetical protein
LTRHLKAIGAKYVIDSSFARCFSLLLSYEELKGRTEPIFASACPGQSFFHFPRPLVIAFSSIQAGFVMPRRRKAQLCSIG